MQILVSSNHKLTRDLLSGFLADLDYAVEFFNISGKVEPDLEKKLAGKDCLIIADVDKWAQQIISALSGLHLKFPDIPIIVVNQADVSVSTQTSIDCGVFGFLRRPLHLDELELMLIRLSEHKRWGMGNN